MSQASKHQRHEQARKQHRREAKAHAREMGKRPPKTFPLRVLMIGLGVMLLGVVVATVAAR